jgi:recombinational DNA repair protein (RecF pathway)
MCLLTLSFMPSVLQNVGIDLNLQECEEKKSEDQSWMVQAASLGSFMLSVRTMTMV